MPKLSVDGSADIIGATCAPGRVHSERSSGVAVHLGVGTSSLR